MQFDELLSHPAYNHEHALAAMMFARKIGQTEDLAEEVTESYWNEIKSAFASSDYPVTKKEYFVHASNALYEWDI